MTGSFVVPPQAQARGVLGRGPVLPQGERLRVLLVEDDEGDAFLVAELLAEADVAIDLLVATSLNQARQQIAGVDCVLLDLGLPDAHGLDGLRQVLALASGAAVCVLTGRQDEHLGIGAVVEGAQDYLVKGQVDGVLLTRSLRYAVERKRADENARRLREAELRQASARLERFTLPVVEPAAGEPEASTGPGGPAAPAQAEPPGSESTGGSADRADAAGDTAEETRGMKETMA